MFIYNITTKIDNAVADEWLLWQKQVYIPEVMNTGLFYDHRCFKLIEQNEADGETFIIQFYTKNKDSYDSYLVKHSDILIKKSLNRWVINSLHFNPCLSLCNNCA